MRPFVVTHSVGLELRLTLSPEALLKTLKRSLRMNLRGLLSSMIGLETILRLMKWKKFRFELDTPLPFLIPIRRSEQDSGILFTFCV